MPQTSNNPTYVDILWEQKIQDSSIYWINKPKIIEEIEVEKSGSSSVSVKLKYFEFRNNQTWQVSYEWFWFKPSSYEIKAWASSNQDWWANSYAVYIDWNTSTFYLRQRQEAVSWDINTWQYQTWVYNIYIYDDEWLFSRWKHIWFTNDWIIIDWDSADVDVKFTITAYK